MLKAVVASLDEHKAEALTIIDLRGRSSLADHMIIATGQSSRQMGAMANHLLETLKAFNLSASVEGMTQGDWVLIDAGDIIIHLFRPEVRVFYNLEHLWDVAPVGTSLSA